MKKLSIILFLIAVMTQTSCAQTKTYEVFGGTLTQNTIYVSSCFGGEYATDELYFDGSKVDLSGTFIPQSEIHIASINFGTVAGINNVLILDVVQPHPLLPVKMYFVYAEADASLHTNAGFKPVKLQ